MPYRKVLSPSILKPDDASTARLSVTFSFISLQMPRESLNSYKTSCI